MKRTTAIAVTIALLLSVNRSTAQQPLTGDLKLVPSDAAVFGYLDVSKFYRSKFAASIRELEVPVAFDPENFDANPVDPKAPKKVNPYKEFVKKFLDTTGIDIETIKTATFFIPDANGQRDENSFVLALTLPKYDRVKLISGLMKFDERFKEIKDIRPNLMEFPNMHLRVGFPSETQLFIMGENVKLIPIEQSGEKGVITPVLQAAANGKMAVFTINKAYFPQELNTNFIPAEFRPLKALFQSELNYATLDLEGETVVASVHMRCENQAITNDAEKALQTLMKLASVSLDETQKYNLADMNNHKTFEPIINLVSSLQEVVKAAKYESGEKEARLDLKMKADAKVAGTILSAASLIRNVAGNSVTANNLRNIVLAMHEYSNANETLPPAGICDKNGKPLLSWRVALLPYIKQEALYKQFKLDEPWDSEHNIKLSKKVVSTYILPSDGPDENKTHFRVFVGGDKEVDTPFNFKKGITFNEISDGMSVTIFVVVSKEKVVWTKPDELTFDPKGNPESLLYFKNNYTPVAFGIGLVKSLPKNYPVKTWRALITRNGGELIEKIP